MFSSDKWKYWDQFEGKIVKIKDSFFKNVEDLTKIKRLKPKDIDKEVSHVEGRYMKTIMFDNEVYYDICQNLPFELIEERYPLLSHSNYREDIQYLRNNKS